MIKSNDPHLARWGKTYRILVAWSGIGPDLKNRKTYQILVARSGIGPDFKNRKTYQVLVAWSGIGPELQKWEDLWDSGCVVPNWSGIVTKGKPIGFWLRGPELVRN